MAWGPPFHMIVSFLFEFCEHTWRCTASVSNCEVIALHGCLVGVAEASSSPFRLIIQLGISGVSATLKKCITPVWP